LKFWRVQTDGVILKVAGSRASQTHSMHLPAHILSNH
jgi:hypothetical protein